MKHVVVQSHAGKGHSVLRRCVSKILRERRHLALAGSIGGMLLGPPAGFAEGASDAPANTLTEVTVTAQRKSQTTESIPYNITSVDAGQIAATGATTLNDLTRVVPGLTTVDEGPDARGGNNNLTLRGLRTDSPGGGRSVAELPGQAVNSVSTYFGETPVFFPMPLYDVERVEVLRGPQGTLYGSGAQAGTIRFIPTAPEFESLSGTIDTTASYTQSSSDINRDVKGALNLPLGEHFATRIVAGYEHDGGFIDDVDLWQRTGSGPLATPTPSIAGDLTSGPVLAPIKKDANSTNQEFERIALRWNPTEAVDIELDYLHQLIKSADAQIGNPGFAGGPFDLTTPVAGPISASNPPFYPNSSVGLRSGGVYDNTTFSQSPYQERIDLVSTVATVDVGFATVTSASSFYNNRTVGNSDYTPLFYGLPTGLNFNAYPPYNFYPRLLAVQPVTAVDESFIQEFRMVSTGDNIVDYVVGAYYQHQQGSSLISQYIPGLTDYLTATGQPNPTADGDLAWMYSRHTLFKDVAGFSEVTWHATHAWQITGGIRLFHQTFDANVDSNLPLCGAACASDLTDTTGSSSAAASTATTRAIKKINTSYDLTDNMKVYATYSEGFRRGGANALPVTGPYASLPNFQTFSPDIAKNYEVGLKGIAFDHRLRYSADIYRINLNNFQFDTVNLAGFPVTYNGKTARSQGVETELEAALGYEVTATLGYTYTDAKVTQSFDILDYPPYALVPSFGGTGATASVLGGGIESGYRLPGVPKNTLSASIEKRMGLESLGLVGASFIAHVDGSYRSAETSNISPVSPYNWIIPSNFMGNARLTLDTGHMLSFALFTNNFTNNPGYSGGTNLQTYPNFARERNVARPRTIGLTARVKF